MAHFKLAFMISKIESYCAQNPSENGSKNGVNILE